MASQAEKLLITHGLGAALESTYGGGHPTSFTYPDDAILVEERVEVTPIFNTDGERSPGTGQGGRYLKVSPGGRHADFTIAVLARGSNAAYSSSVFPSDLHVLLRACGHSVTTVASVGVESQTYAPDTTPDGSAALQAFSRAEQFDLTGVLGSMSFTIDGPTFTRFDFALRGIMDTDPVDAAVPDLSGIAQHQPPKAEAITLNIGNYVAPRVKSVTFNQNLNLQNRNDVNAASGFAGIAQGFRDPQLEVVLEASALEGSPFHGTTGIDPYALWEAATQLPVDFTVGSTQYNRFTFSAPQAQITNVDKGEEGEVALWTVQFGLAQTVPGADDDYSLVFD